MIGLWFSLRTHASQIWQNPQQLMQPELPVHNRHSVYHRLASSGISHSLNRRESHANIGGSRSQTPVPQSSRRPPSPVMHRRVSYANQALPPPPGFTPVLESVDQAMKTSGMQPMNLPPAMTTDDFTRAVAVATVSALRHQQAIPPSPGPARTSSAEHDAGGGHGGHDAPSWNRTTSASVLMGCTLLYAIIAGMPISLACLFPAYQRV